MPTPTNTSPAARTSLLYITVGGLLVIWTAIWFYYLQNHPPEEGKNGVYYWCTGLMLSGFGMLVIGFFLGRIGKAARELDLPPKNATAPAAPPTAAQVPAGQPTAAVPTAPVAPVVNPPPAQGVARPSQGMPAGRVG